MKYVEMKWMLSKYIYLTHLDITYTLSKVPEED